MAWQFTKEQIAQLDELESSARWVHNGSTVTCELVDDRTREVWCRGDSNREPEALDEALKAAKGTARETSIGSAMAERDRLKSENERLLKMIEDQKQDKTVANTDKQPYATVARRPGRPSKKPATVEA